MSDKWMIYGANGYTGQLTAELASQKGLHPILAGRNQEAVRSLADRYGFEYRIFDLDVPSEVDKGLEGIAVVAHMAGPFIHTSRAMVDACIRNGTHYLDITGEWPVFEAIHARNEEAKIAGVVLLPGAGFDVVPTDCLAALLAEKMPDGVELELAISGTGASSKSISRGTLKSMIEGLGRGSAIRKDGRIVPASYTWRAPVIDFPGKGKRQCVTMPWGDISTAYYSTGIKNISVYFEGKPGAMKAVDFIRPALGLAPVKRTLQWLVGKTVFGPDKDQRERSRALFWGRVTDENGAQITGTLITPEGYSLTADSSVKAVLRLLDGDISPGAHTPSTAFGADFVRSLKGVTAGVFDRA